MTTVRVETAAEWACPKPSFDTPLAQKQQNTKQSKNAYKKEHDAKKDRDMEMKGKPGKGQKGVKAPVMPPQPKKEEAKVEEIKTIVIPEVITIKELAEKMKLQSGCISLRSSSYRARS